MNSCLHQNVGFSKHCKAKLIPENSKKNYRGIKMINSMNQICWPVSAVVTEIPQASLLIREFVLF